MKQKTFKAFVIRPPNSDDENIYKDLQVDVTYGSKNTFIALIRFFLFVIKDRKGIYQLYNTGPYFLLALRILGVRRVVYSIHGTIYWRNALQKFFRKLAWSLALTKKAVVTANSEYSASVFSEKINKVSKPVILYNPIDTNRFNPGNVNHQKGEIKIIYVGRMVRGKNLDKWFDAADYLLKNGVNATFELYGSGPFEEEVKHWVEAAGLQEKIKVKGHVSNIENIYKDADLLLFLSAYESFGNVVVESILCSTPVITFDIPSMKEIFKDYPGFLIKNNDQYKENILSKVNSISEFKSLAKKVSLDFEKQFACVNHFNKLNTIYAGFN